jgi:hypothetical protein
MVVVGPGSVILELWELLGAKLWNVWGFWVVRGTNLVSDNSGFDLGLGFNTGLGPIGLEIGSRRNNIWNRTPLHGRL